MTKGSVNRNYYAMSFAFALFAAAMLIGVWKASAVPDVPMGVVFAVLAFAGAFAVGMAVMDGEE